MTGFYWSRGRRPKPPEYKASPAYLAWAASVRANVWNCEAADDGLAGCPRCGATRGVRLFKLNSYQYGSGRHYRAECWCGQKGRVFYSQTTAAKAWNNPDWRRCIDPVPPESVPPIPDPSAPLLDRPPPSPEALAIGDARERARRDKPKRKPNR